MKSHCIDQTFYRAHAFPFEAHYLLCLCLHSGELVDRLSPHKPLKVVANYGVGVDHLALDGTKMKSDLRMEFDLSSGEGHKPPLAHSMHNLLLTSPRPNQSCEPAASPPATRPACSRGLQRIWPLRCSWHARGRSPRCGKGGDHALLARTGHRDLMCSRLHPPLPLHSNLPRFPIL